MALENNQIENSNINDDEISFKQFNIQFCLALNLTKEKKKRGKYPFKNIY